MVRFEGQRLAVPFLVAAVLLFLVQLIAGGLLAAYYISPDVLSGVANFNLLRAYHINALLFWLFSATFAAVIYITPVLSGRDLWGKGLVKLFAALLVLVVARSFFTLPLMQTGDNVWFLGQPMLYEGKEYVEIGRLWDLLLLGFAIFAVVVVKSLPPVREWPLALWALAMGAVVAFVLYIPGNLFFEAVPTSEYFRWWTVHYWVEGALEVAYAGAFGLLLMVLIPDPRVKKIVDKYIYYDVVLAATSGVIGQGHHYFWIGTPTFWIMMGGVISALEVVPLVLMALESLRIAREGKLRVENVPALYFAVGILVYGLVGVALQGLVITLPWTNWWEHGTWTTMLHAHMCMMAFAMGAMAFIYFMTPDLAGKPVDATFVVWGKRAFWLMFVGQAVLAVSFGLAGVVQINRLWILGEEWESVLEARLHFMPGVVLGGALVFLGYLHYAASVFRHLLFPVSGEPYQPGKPPRGFLTTLNGVPLLVALALLFALVGVTGLWSFSSTMVLEHGAAWLPYSLFATSAVGLASLAVVLAAKFARSVEHGYY